MSKITKQTMDQQNTERVVDQDYPLEHVPKSARKSLLSISCVLIGFTFFTPTMASGASLGAAFKFDELILSWQFSKMKKLSIIIKLLTISRRHTSQIIIMCFVLLRAVQNIR